MRFLVMLIAGSLITAAPHVGVAAPGIQLTPGQTVAYKGSVQVTQSSGDEVLEDNRYEAYLLCSLYKAPDGKLRLFTARLLTSASGREAEVSFDELAVQGTLGSTEGVRLEFLSEPAMEMEESFLKMAVYFPINILPQFPLPTAGQEGRVEKDVSVMTFDEVKLAFTTRLAKEGAHLTATRTLSGDAEPTFKFRGEPSTVDTWRERYVLNPDTGLPERLETKVVLDVKYAGDILRIERALKLDAIQQSVSASEGLAGLAKELRQITADFEARKSAAKVATRVTAFGTLAKSSPTFQPALDALTKRLEGYRRLMLGSAPPDFKLDSLDGKKVSLGQAIEGKVTLLTFWAYG